MKKLTRPEIEFIEFDENDVIATSGSKLTFPYTEGQEPTQVDDPSETKEYDEVTWNINS